jgi:hypothetical protein
MFPPINCFHHGFFPGEGIRKFGQVEDKGRPIGIVVVPVIVVPAIVFDGFFLEKEFGSSEGRAGLENFRILKNDPTNPLFPLRFFSWRKNSEVWMGGPAWRNRAGKLLNSRAAKLHAWPHQNSEV